MFSIFVAHFVLWPYVKKSLVDAQIQYRDVFLEYWIPNDGGVTATGIELSGLREQPMSLLRGTVYLEPRLQQLHYRLYWRRLCLRCWIGLTLHGLKGHANLPVEVNLTPEMM